MERSIEDEVADSIYPEVWTMRNGMKWNQQPMPEKKHHGHKESSIQCSCVTWFRLQYPNLLLASIPNGGVRNKITASIMKQEGAVAGMPDLFLYVVRGGYHGLALELKTDKGRQAESQKSIEQRLMAEGYLYKIVRSFDEFKEVIETYLQS